MATSPNKAPILISSASSPSIMSMAPHSASDHLFRAAAVSAANKHTTAGPGGSPDKPMSFQSNQVPPPVTISSQLTSGAANSTPLDSMSNWWSICSTNSPRTSPFLGRRTRQFFIPDNMNIDSQLDKVLEQANSTSDSSQHQHHLERSNLVSRFGQLSELNSASAYQCNNNNDDNSPSTNLLARPNINTPQSTMSRNKSYHGISGHHMFLAPAPVGLPAEKLSALDELKPSTNAGSSSATPKAVNQSAKISKGASKSSFRFDVANFDINAVGPSSW